MQKPFRYFVLFTFFIGGLFSQSVIKNYSKDSSLIYFKEKDFINKTIPLKHKEAICIALTKYPELNQIKIKFILKKKLAPLAARPTFFTIFFKPNNRKYKIIISKSTIKKLQPILLENLTFNAQIGVLGHEIGHISEYNTKRGWFFISLVFKHLFSKKAIDNFEFNTDKRSVEHGLGFQLLSWSTEVRNKLDIKIWGGANNAKSKRERYMNPETILNVMDTLRIYN